MADINIVVKMQADQAIKGSEKLKNSLTKTETVADKLSIQIKNTTQAYKGFSANLKAIGVSRAISELLTLTGAIKNLGIDAVKAASDSEETLNKFNVVFQDVSDSANKMASELANSYGLATSESKALLASTGDLLTGFGFSGESALDLSGEVQKLAVDLASFTNFSGGAKGASEALTKALLGERESVKSLGISILEEDVNKQVAINSAKGLVFETERQAKAQATLDIALRQSKNAIGDFARSQGSFANQSKILTARMQDLKEGIGSQLLPVVTKATSDFIKLLKSFDQEKIKQFVKDGVTSAINGLKSLVDYINPVVTGLKLLGNVVTIVKNVFEVGFGSILRIATEVSRGVVNLFSLILRAVPTSLLPDSLAEGFNSFESSVRAAAEGLDGFSEGIKETINGDITDLTESIKGVGNAFSDTISEETLSVVNESLDSYVSAVETANDKVIVSSNKTAKAIIQDQVFQTAAQKKALEDQAKMNKQLLDLDQRHSKARVDVFSATSNLITAVSAKGSKLAFAISKAAAIAQSIIATNVAVAMALATPPGPLYTAPLAASIRLAGNLNTAAIAATAIQGFEHGGVVPGSSFSGDNVTANVNSGEMILNRAQQSELFNIAKGNNSANSQNIQTNITLELDGEVITRAVSRSVANGTVLGQEGV